MNSGGHDEDVMSRPSNKVCPSCGKSVPPYNDHCYNCGYDYPPDGLTKPKAESRSRYPMVEQRLALASSDWTAAVALRQYKGDQQGQELFAKEVEVFGIYGYAPVTQSADGGHVHVGRLLMTGGLSVFAGKRGIRSDGTIAVTFKLDRAAPSPAQEVTVSDGLAAAAGGLDILTALEKLGQLRDAGILTTEEFDLKKAELLARL
jgi:hypothetical protein